MHVAEIAVLRMAKHLIERHGWVRGKLCSTEGYCVAGAIFAATDDWQIRDAALDAIRSETKSQFVVCWNDRVPDGKKEVVAVMKRAIDRATMKPERRQAGTERGSIFA